MCDCFGGSQQQSSAVPERPQPFNLVIEDGGPGANSMDKLNVNSITELKAAEALVFKLREQLGVAERKVQSLRKTDPAPAATDDAPSKGEPTFPTPPSSQASPVIEENGVEEAAAEAAAGGVRWRQQQEEAAAAEAAEAAAAAAEKKKATEAMEALMFKQMAEEAAVKKMAEEEAATKEHIIAKLALEEAAAKADAEAKAKVAGEKAAADKAKKEAAEMKTPEVKKKSTSVSTPGAKKFGFGRVSPKETIENVANNDPSVTKVDFAGNASFQVKADEYCEILGEALKNNTYVTELDLSNCDIRDRGAIAIADMLAQNHTIQTLDMQKNNIMQPGCLALPKGIASNQGLRVINLSNQQKAIGEVVLTEFVKVFDTNVTLLKIMWRVESRQAFALSKLLTRNNEINRRLKTNREYEDLLPEELKTNQRTLTPYDM